MWDSETIFSNRQPLTDASAETESENIVSAGADDLGLGEPVYLQISLTSGCSGSLTAVLSSSEAADMAGAVRLAQYSVPASAVSRGGTVLAAALPTGCGRYLRLTYTGAEGGNVTAGLVQGAQTSGMR